MGAATLAAGAARIPDLGVLVEDAWQRRGIGTRLTALVVDRARSTGVTSVHADILNEDLFILRALRRLGPLTTTYEHGTVAIDIDLADRLSRSDGTSFPFAFVDEVDGGHRVAPSGIREPETGITRSWPGISRNSGT